MCVVLCQASVSYLGILPCLSLYFSFIDSELTIPVPCFIEVCIYQMFCYFVKTTQTTKNKETVEKYLLFVGHRNHKCPVQYIVSYTSCH